MPGAARAGLRKPRPRRSCKPAIRAGWTLASAWGLPWALVSVLAYAMACVLVLAGCSTPNPALKAAAAKQAMCSACHGADGGSVSVPAPVLAGQQQAYLVAQLTALRDRSRANDKARTFMWPMAASLSDAEIDNLASHFAALPPPRSTAVQDATASASAGQSLYETGAPDRGIVPCSTCHGDKGQGMAGFPRLAGQHADYLAAQLAAFADGSRASPVMGAMARNLSAQDAQRLAAYLAAL